MPVTVKEIITILGLDEPVEGPYRKPGPPMIGQPRINIPSLVLTLCPIQRRKRGKIVVGSEIKTSGNIPIRFFQKIHRRVNPHTAQKAPPVKIITPRFVKVEFLFDKKEPPPVAAVEILRETDARSKAVP